MHVSVRFFTVLRELTGKKEETLSFPEEKTVTVAIVLKNLSERYGKAFTEYVCDSQNGEIKSFLQFFINGKSASILNGSNSEMRDGDVLAIVPPVGGG